MRKTILILLLALWPALAHAQSLTTVASALKGGATLPTKCSPATSGSKADVFVKTGSSAGIYSCSAANTWTLAGGGAGTTINSTDGRLPYRSSSSAFDNSPLARIDADTMEQANSTNAQVFNIYGTKTDGSNYVRLSIAPDATTVSLGAESAGTGTANLDINLIPKGTGKLKSGGSAVSLSNPTPTFTTLTDGATVTWAFTSPQLVGNATVTLGGNRTLSITGVSAGATGVLVVVQDGTGSRTLTLPAGSKVVNGGSGAVTLSTAAASIDILAFVYDGTNFYWTVGTGYN